MARVPLNRTRIYLDGRDISLLINSADLSMETVEDVLDVLWRPQPIHVPIEAKATGSFTSHLFKDNNYIALEEAINDMMTRYSIANGFTYEKRIFEEITEDSFRQITETRQTDTSGTGRTINFAGITETVTIRGDRLDYVTLNVITDGITVGDGVEISNDKNTDKVYIRKADIATGEKKYTLYTAKAGSTQGYMTTNVVGSEPDIGGNIVLTFKATKSGDTLVCDSNLANTQMYYILEESVWKRHWLEFRMTDPTSSKLIKIILKYVQLKLGSETTENAKVPSFTVNFTADDIDIQKV
jgi:hypothetical protein